MTTNSTWAALRNPAFRKLWIAAVISGTCVAAQDSAATWTMNIFTGSPLLLSLMSTVASLPFFLFTLPAGALADKVDRRKLVCTVHQENGALAADFYSTCLQLHRCPGSQLARWDRAVVSAKNATVGTIWQLGGERRRTSRAVA